MREKRTAITHHLLRWQTPTLLPLYLIKEFYEMNDHVPTQPRHCQAGKAWNVTSIGDRVLHTQNKAAMTRIAVPQTNPAIWDQ